MSFSSLLNEISKDKKLKQKITPVSTSLSNKQSVKTAKLSSQPSKPTTHIPSQRQTTISKFTPSNIIDPSVIRLKEARRKEKERLEALKNAKKPSKNASSNKRPAISRAKSSTSQKKSTPLLSTSSKSKQNNYSNKSNIPNTSPKVSSGPKLSFKELMKQAESVDSKQLVINPIKKVQSNSKIEPSRALKAIKISRKESPINANNANDHLRSFRPSASLQPLQAPVPQQHRPISNLNKTQPNLGYRETLSKGKDTNYTNSNVPAGPSLFAKPNPELLNRLKNKKKKISMSRPPRNSISINRSSSNYTKKIKDDYGIDATDDDELSDQGYGYNYDYDDYDDDDDGFIVDDDDDNFERRNRNRERERERRKFENDRRSKERGYDRNEIWEIFNRGKKRNFNDYQEYDDYDDDMEATGTEILEDEERTLRQAKVDDLREQKLLEKRQLEKKRLLAKKNL